MPYRLRYRPFEKGKLMSAETDSRKMPPDHPKRALFEHLVVDHAVRINRKRYLPSAEKLAHIHAQCHLTRPTGWGAGHDGV